MKTREIEILMQDGCTRAEAEKHLKNGTTIFEDFEENFNKYIEEWSFDEEEKAEYRKMVAEKKPLTDWGIVEDGERTYYIQYCL